MATQTSETHKSRVRGVSYKMTARQYVAKVGYTDRDRRGNPIRRTRAFQYLGSDLREAEKKYMALSTEWDQVVEAAKHVYQQWLTTPEGKEAQNLWNVFQDGSALKAGREKYAPVWPTVATVKKTEEVRSEVSKVSVEQLTIGEMKDQFVAAYASRSELVGRKSVKKSTQFNLERELRLALDTPPEAGITKSSRLTSLKRSNFETFIDYWHHHDRKLSARTAANYCRAVKKMLDWVNDRDLGLSLPPIDRLFRFRVPKGKIEKYDKEQVKRCLAACTEQTKLFVVLSLNTGYTQVDIENLKRDELVYKDNRLIPVARRRDKTSHQNDFETYHALWEETAKLIETHLAQENAWGLAFLTRDGKPHRHLGTKTTISNVAQCWKRDMADVADPLPFKQFRKFGITAIKRITGLPDVARRYAGHKIDGALANYDRDDFFEPLTNALAKWRLELMADGVL